MTNGFERKFISLTLVNTSALLYYSIFNMEDSNAKRKALREKLRLKREERTGVSVSSHRKAQNIREDPACALLAMGIDDASVIRNAKEIVRNPHEIVNAAKSVLAVEKNVTTNDDSDDEEAPPPQAP